MNPDVHNSGLLLNFTWPGFLPFPFLFPTSLCTSQNDLPTNHLYSNPSLRACFQQSPAKEGQGSRQSIPLSDHDLIWKEHVVTPLRVHRFQTHVLLLSLQRQDRLVPWARGPPGSLGSFSRQCSKQPLPARKRWPENWNLFAVSANTTMTNT